MYREMGCTFLPPQELLLVGGWFGAPVILNINCFWTGLSSRFLSRGFWRSVSHFSLLSKNCFLYRSNLLQGKKGSFLGASRWLCLLKGFISQLKNRLKEIKKRENQRKHLYDAFGNSSSSSGLSNKEKGCIFCSLGGWLGVPVVFNGNIPFSFF